VSSQQQAVSSVVSLESEQTMQTNRSIAAQQNNNVVVDKAFTNSDVSDSRIHKQKSLDQTLTASQLEQQILAAKRQAQQAKLNNAERQKRLKESLNTAEDELQSLLKLDISYELDQWKRAWEIGDSARYLSFYSKSFLPTNGVSHKVWQTQRQQRVTPSKKVSINMSDFDVSFSNKNTQSRVDFTQSYESDAYSDRVRKRLVLRKELQRWKIISEIEINEQAIY